MAKLLEGKILVEQIKSILRDKINSAGKKLKLVSIQVGVNPACEVYVKSQKRAADLLGIEYQLHQLDKVTNGEGLVSFIQELNQDNSVNGIIIQLPLPLHIDYKKISQFITPGKDVEGMHPLNLGKLIFGKAKILPCTAAAVMELLSSIGLNLSGKEVVIVGHSEIVGKPLSLLLLEKLATVTVCHIGTFKAGKLEEHIKRADVLIMAVGKAGLVKGEWIKEGAVVIDVGINKVGDKIVGDVDFEGASKRASWITPVPGGVGPLTVIMLMRNLVEGANL
ncbi:MAG: bifunctional 5,10-methylenetetrahydrofolate dehydrogenase/5,10-methenyltetrahydrofolate cyclohydrolase [Candidatus Omnitrophota bacterium]|nr:bifunctional 5,10-methylenetetrahydrofolate dehydrogenase/5,10-methenyltetrahydrofolate cyclohydrolase [Candidatus Omnitrophota bacterium]MBU1928885.1 bifunctional 5,10-methylenetetrahydrofolate dehydrogenase/5,10-methenyltetrahydrofolate cyclohydrolase [Candidatus Omnitrophota bacterium]MBU2034495.1 bifunctional 5,10-methylenetetrahydrofolate dehydrogenase/5,10-methenyltetrahydrofolate cyclohydrolase [Candidatus Omnitrophota bacterium]MBU2221329.1 bifunctional 5,10-methylenetetrahydrofolate 